MELIERDELKAKIDRGDDFCLVNALGGWAFRASRIPGSVHFDSPEEAMAALGVDDDIVVYCSDPACIASRFAAESLVANGYRHVRRYAGGLSDWAAAGYPLVGEAVG